MMSRLFSSSVLDYLRQLRSLTDSEADNHLDAMIETPSELLKSLASFHEPRNYLKLLEKHVYPFLDRLPPNQLDSLVAVLTTASNEYEGVGLIGYESRSESITKGLKALVAHVESNWHGGYETQGEMMGKIVGEIAEWIENLWTVGVEMGVEHMLVHKSLQFCQSSLNKLGSTKSRTEFGDIDCPEITVKEVTGKVVYRVPYESTKHAILWVWRELLLSSIVHSKDESLAKTLVGDIEKMDLSHEMLARLVDEISPPPQLTDAMHSDASENTDIDWAAEERRDLLLNAHWSPEMRAAVPRIKALLVSGQIAAFEKAPSVDVYRSLIGAMPQLKDRLLTSTRSHFLPPKDRFTRLKPAFDIFRCAGTDYDLIRLLEVSATCPHHDQFQHETSIQEVISQLMSSSGDTRSNVRVHLESGLLGAQEAVTEAMEHAFPTLFEAWRYLEGKMDAGELSKVAPEMPATDDKRPKHAHSPSQGRSGAHPHLPPDGAARDLILKAFCDKAGWTEAEEYDSDEEDEDCMYYSDEEVSYDWDRYQSRAEKEDIDVSVIRMLQTWVKLLDNWPDATERDVIKETMCAVDKDGRAFFDVDGVAEALARRCDYGSEPCRQKLGRAIRQLYYSFAKEGAEKERIKKKMLPNLSFHAV